MNHSSQSSSKGTDAAHSSPEKLSVETMSEYERYRQMQMEQFEDDIAEGRCYPEMPEGQFVRSK